MDSGCATIPSIDSQIERHMALHRPIREPQDVTSLWRARAHLFRLTMGLAPSTTISHNSVNTNSITSVLGSNDDKTCTFYNNTLFLHKELTKSHSIPNPDLGCARYRAKSLTSILKRPEPVGSVNYRTHPSKPCSG